MEKASGACGWLRSPWSGQEQADPHQMGCRQGQGMAVIEHSTPGSRQAGGFSNLPGTCLLPSPEQGRPLKMDEEPCEHFYEALQTATLLPQQQCECLCQCFCRGDGHQAAWDLRAGCARSDAGWAQLPPPLSCWLMGPRPLAGDFNCSFSHKSPQGWQFIYLPHQPPVASQTLEIVGGPAARGRGRAAFCCRQ